MIIKLLILTIIMVPLGTCVLLLAGCNLVITPRTSINLGQLVSWEALPYVPCHLLTATRAMHTNASVPFGRAARVHCLAAQLMHG